MRVDGEMLHKNPAYMANSGRVVDRTFGAGYFANIISHSMRAFANGDHGTSLDRVILHEWLRRVTWGENKCSELVTNGGAGNKKSNTRIKAVKTFP